MTRTEQRLALHALNTRQAAECAQRAACYRVPTEAQRRHDAARAQRIRNRVGGALAFLVAFAAAVYGWMHLIPAQPVPIRDDKPAPAASTVPAHGTQTLHPRDQFAPGEPPKSGSTP